MIMNLQLDFIYLQQNLIFKLKGLLDKEFHDKIDTMYKEYRIVSIEISVSS